MGIQSPPASARTRRRPFTRRLTFGRRLPFTGQLPFTGRLTLARHPAVTRRRLSRAAGIIAIVPALTGAATCASARADGGAPLAGPPTGGPSTVAHPTAGSRTAGPAPRHPSPSRPASEPRMVRLALTRIGSPYRTGATGPRAFDCSGLVTWAARRSGLTVPRVSFDQYRVGRPVARGRVKAGDLVFFDTGGPGASDVGIAVGPRSAVSATVSGGVRVHSIFGPYWGRHYVGARRLSGGNRAHTGA